MLWERLNSLRGARVIDQKLRSQGTAMTQNNTTQVRHLREPERNYRSSFLRPQISNCWLQFIS